MKRTITALLVLTALLACTSQTRRTATDKTITIGVLADQTGPYATSLRGIPRGVEMAVDEFEQQQDVTVETYIGDQQSCKTKHTTTIMQRFTKVDKVDFVVGGTCSSTTITAAPIANQTSTPLISPSSSAPSISGLGDHVFRTYINDAQRASLGANIVAERNISEAAIIVDGSNDAAVEVGNAFSERLNANTTTITVQGNTDFRTEALKAREADAVIFTFTGPSKILRLLKQLQRHGTYQLLLSPFETVKAVSVLNSSASEDVVFIQPGKPQNNVHTRIAEEYEQQYNESLPKYTAEAYDAAMLGLHAAAAADTSRELVRKLHNISQGYEGVSGNVSFDDNGDVHKDLAAKQIQDGTVTNYTR